MALKVIFLVDCITEFDIYNAQSLLTGGYLGSDINFTKKFQTSIGWRIENFQQELNSGSTKVDNHSLSKLQVQFHFRDCD